MSNKNLENNILLQARNLWKTFGVGETSVNALQEVSFEAEAGSFTAVLGPSGSGKSTLLHLLGAMDNPDRGEILLEGAKLSNLSNRQLTKLRLRRIGFIFQTFNLIPTLTALENVMLPIKLGGTTKGEAKERAENLLKKVGLGDRIKHLPSQLSGGQKQRVAIARALANNPALILADEPTGNLDSKNSDIIMKLLQDLQNSDHAVIMVTHNAELAKLADKVLVMQDGRIAK